jgi:hypothetical protein
LRPCKQSATSQVGSLRSIGEKKVPEAVCVHVIVSLREANSLLSKEVYLRMEERIICAKEAVDRAVNEPRV